MRKGALQIHGVRELQITHVLRGFERPEAQQYRFGRGFPTEIAAKPQLLKGRRTQTTYFTILFEARHHKTIVKFEVWALLKPDWKPLGGLLELSEGPTNQRWQALRSLGCSWAVQGAIVDDMLDTA